MIGCTICSLPLGLFVNFWVFESLWTGGAVGKCMWTLWAFAGRTTILQADGLRHRRKRVDELSYNIMLHYNVLALLPEGTDDSLLPIFPKQRVLQNRTLAIQVHTPMLSFLISPSKMALSTVTLDETLEREEVGVGTRSGLTPSTTAVPIIPINEER